MGWELRCCGFGATHSLPLLFCAQRLSTPKRVIPANAGIQVCSGIQVPSIISHRGEIDPLRIFLFDQIQLPLSVPLFHLLLSLDRIANVAKPFEVNEQVDAIFFCETFNKSLLMFEDSALNVIRHADVKRSITLARHDIDVVILHISWGLDSRIRGNDKLHSTP